MTFTTHTDTPDLIDRWPYDFQRIRDTDTGGPSQYEYLSAFATELRRIDVFIDELYEQRFLETATNRELEKLAAPVGVTRRAGEADDELRYRARLGKAIAASDGTAKDIEAILTIAFSEDQLDAIEVGRIDGEPIISFTIPEPYIEDIPITESRLNELLTTALPCGTAAQIITGDTFELGATGSKGIGEGRLV